MLLVFIPAAIVLLIIYGAACLNLKTPASVFLTSMALSFTASLGGYCLLMFLVSTPEKNPITFPSSIVGMLLCFAAFVALLILYVIKRKKHPSAVGVVIDVLVAVLMTIPILFCIAAMHEIISTAFFRSGCYYRDFF